MNLKKTFFAILVIALSVVSCKVSNPLVSPETGKYATATGITEGDIHWHISVLASDSMQGRKAGTPYEALAAKYIKEKFVSLGLKAVGNDYYQSVPLFQRKLFQDCDLHFDNYTGAYATDFRPLVMFDSLTVSGEVVFAGYGYDSDYDNLDVKGKWVMLLEGKGSDKIVPKAKQDIYSRYETAKNREVLGVLSILTDEAVRSEQSFLQSNSTSIPILKISIKMADRLFAKAGVDFTEVLSKVAADENYSIAIPAIVHATIKSEIQSPVSHNVIACLKANRPENEQEYFVIGAHYDHIGTQTVGNTTSICRGADDNASGVAGLLEIAEKLRSEKNLKYSFIFVAFGGEELGLFGSQFFCKNPPVPLEKIKLMVNLDMIGRMDSANHAYINTVEPTDRFNATLERMKRLHPDISTVFPSDDIFHNSDHSSFWSKDIPAVGFTTGLHNDYHTPADTLGAINCKGEKRLLDFVYDFILTEGRN